MKKGEPLPLWVFPSLAGSALDGKILSTATLVVSDDGKTLTITSTGKDAKGQNIDSVAVYDKQ